VQPVEITADPLPWQPPNLSVLVCEKDPQRKMDAPRLTMGVYQHIGVPWFGTPNISRSLPQ
jgi:hypothetical protein